MVTDRDRKGPAGPGNGIGGAILVRAGLFSPRRQRFSSHAGHCPVRGLASVLQRADPDDVEVDVLRYELTLHPTCHEHGQRLVGALQGVQEQDGRFLAVDRAAELQRVTARDGRWPRIARPALEGPRAEGVVDGASTTRSVRRSSFGIPMARQSESSCRTAMRTVAMRAAFPSGIAAAGNGSERVDRVIERKPGRQLSCEQGRALTEQAGSATARPCGRPLPYEPGRS